MSDPNGNDCRQMYLVGWIIVALVLIGLIILLITNFWDTLKAIGLVVICCASFGIYLSGKYRR